MVYVSIYLSDYPEQDAMQAVVDENRGYGRGICILVREREQMPDWVLPMADRVALFKTDGSHTHLKDCLRKNAG